MNYYINNIIEDLSRAEVGPYRVLKTYFLDKIQAQFVLKSLNACERGTKNSGTIPGLKNVICSQDVTLKERYEKQWTDIFRVRL